MNVSFSDKNMARLATDAQFSANLRPEVVSAFRQAIHIFSAAPHESTLAALRFLKFRKSRRSVCRIALTVDTDLEFEIQNGRTEPKLMVKAISPAKKARG